MAQDNNLKVVKVQPYPFPITITRDGKPVPGEVIKLAQKGAIIRCQTAIFSVAEEFDVQFEIPVFKNQLQLHAKVMKTYDRALLKEKGVERLAELLFTNITNEQIRTIYKFLVAIRQEK